MKKAFITGITGQDGSYLAELLLKKNYEVHGMIRRSSSFNTKRIDHLFQDPHAENKIPLYLHYGNLEDSTRLIELIKKVDPDEVYNLAAQSHVRVSFDEPVYTSDIVAVGTLKLLEAVRIAGDLERIRFYQASSSEMYGKVVTIPQNEDTPFHPRSPYACSKVFAYHQVCNYREAYNLHASNGILFNHESPRRGETFVTRKITRGIALILAGKEKKIFLGNLDAKRDWGYAEDYVLAMWMMLQQEKPDDYVIATGKTWSVRDFLERSFACVGLSWENHIEIDPRYYRPSEVDVLIGDASKAKEKLGWEPLVNFDELARRMVKADLLLEGLSSEKYMEGSQICV